MQIPPGHVLYDVLFTFTGQEDVVFLYKIPFDPKVVETKLTVRHPLTGEPKIVTFAGASTRRQNLYRYRELTKFGQLIGG